MRNSGYLLISVRHFRLVVMRYFIYSIILAASFTVAAPTFAQETEALRAPTREANMPNTRWTHQPDHLLWNRAALSALKTHGKSLVDIVPGDIKTWCPHYPEANDADRRAFWLGFMSALAKFESTYKPKAVGPVASGMVYCKFCLRRRVGISVT